MTLTTAIVFAIMVSCTVAANLLMKIGAGETQERWIAGVFGTYSFIGIMFFGAALVLYSWLLRHIALNFAQSIMAIQFILVIICASFFLQEAISPIRWLGILTIFIGILIVGFTEAS